MPKKIASFFLLMIFVLLSGFGCQTVDPKATDAMKPISLTFWGVYDDSDAFQAIIDKYKAIHPNITITYKKFLYSEYENQLLNAWAEDRGPDIFAIQNAWVGKYQTKILPMPDSTTLAYQVTQGTIQKQVVPVLKTTKSLTVSDLKNNYVDVVASDAVLSDGKIYGLPLSVDTLALYYNKDLLNNANIINPPKYWDTEFQQDITKLTKQDPKQGLIQSGIALGTSGNINRASDILMVLMMQNGATIINSGQVSFQNSLSVAGNNYNPGLEALRFYTDFANPQKEVYSWNDGQPDSLSAFASGNLAMMIDYSYDYDQIKALSPKLNFGVAPLPQIEGNQLTVNMANYWLYTVSKKTKYPDAAWDFIQFMAQPDNAKLYLDKTKKPAALRSLIAAQEGDEKLGVFADQVLTAKSWYQGNSLTDAEGAIKNMINASLVNNTVTQDIVNIGAAQVQQTIN
jgi:multiple sugar transport system substrate-binding protein